MGGVCPLFFDGAVCQFKELPKPDNREEINKVYEHLNKIRNINTISKSFFNYGVNKINIESYKRKIFNKFITLFK